MLGPDPPDDLADRPRVITSLLETHYGVKPIIYTGPNFWNQNLGGGFGDHPFWIAQYEVDPPTVPSGWTAWSLWQYQGDAVIEPAERRVDLNRVARWVDLETLRIP